MDKLTIILSFVCGLIAIGLCIFIFTRKTKGLYKFILNALVGITLLFILNLLNVVYLPINPLTLALSGLLGVVGIIVIYVIIVFL